MPLPINGGTFGTGPDTLAVTLSEDAFQGDAQFNVVIDGRTLNAQPGVVTALHNANQSETFTGSVKNLGQPACPSPVDQPG